MPVAKHVEPQLLSDAVLQLFDLVALELGDETAALADQVIVVGAPLGDLVQSLAGTEVPRGRDARFFQQLHRPVHRGQPNARMLASR